MNKINSCLVICLVLGLSAVNGFAESTGVKETAIFASGCFWCTEKDFESVKGVDSAVSGYIGGTQENPTYKQVSKGITGHTEAVLVTYNPELVSYEQLLKVYWYSVDPFVKDRQFCDSGSQYRSAIFYADEKQKQAALESLKNLKSAHGITKKIFTEIVPADKFWTAESYHQDYYKHNPVRYNFYRFNCGRDQRLEEIWGDHAGWKPNKK